MSKKKDYWLKEYGTSTDVLPLQLVDNWIYRESDIIRTGNLNDGFTQWYVVHASPRDLKALRLNKIGHAIIEVSAWWDTIKRKIPFL